MKITTLRTWWITFSIMGIIALILGLLGEHYNIGNMSEMQGLTLASLSLLMPCWMYVGVMVNKKDLAGDKK